MAGVLGKKYVSRLHGSNRMRDEPTETDLEQVDDAHRHPVSPTRRLASRRLRPAPFAREVGGKLLSFIDIPDHLRLRVLLERFKSFVAPSESGHLVTAEGNRQIAF